MGGQSLPLWEDQALCVLPAQMAKQLHGCVEERMLYSFIDNMTQLIMKNVPVVAMAFNVSVFCIHI